MKLKFHLPFKVSTAICLSFLVGCSGQSFKKKIEKDEFDSLKDESFARYNSKRIELYDKKNSDDISKAIAACHEEKFTKGKSLLEDKMQKEKANPFYWNALGTCYLLEEETAKAMYFFNLGIDSLKNYSDTNKNLAEANILNNLGLIQLKYKRYTDAFSSFQKANTLAPKLLTPKINMSQVMLEFNQNQRAITLLKEVLTIAPKDIDVLYFLSLANYRMENFDDSYKYISFIDRDYLNRADIVGLYALNLIKKNKLIDAKEIIEKRHIASEFEIRNKKILDEVLELIKNQRSTL
jgi:tetratricopeptide (TPR) repeat protein